MSPSPRPSDGQARGASTGSPRLAQRYRFHDEDMDYFFVTALGWGAAGGLSTGEAFHLAGQITDGDADSWVAAFRAHGDRLDQEAELLAQQGRLRHSAEQRLTAFASYRSAWQFAPSGAEFEALHATARRAFVQAMAGLPLAATFFETPYAGRVLPGLHVAQADASAPLVLLIGGADTGFEDTFLSAGRGLWERGYAVAMADLPGQGATMSDGFIWEAEAEKPVAAIIERLISHFGARPGRIVLMGCSLGGYFAARAAGYEDRLGAVIASTPFPRPGDMFAAQLARAAGTGSTPSTARRRNRQALLRKAGARDAQDFLHRTTAMQADPVRVTVPFLSIIGAGEDPAMVSQARDWSDQMASAKSELVWLDAASGGDGHVQVANRRRLVQEASSWLDQIFERH